MINITFCGFGILHSSFLLTNKKVILTKHYRSFPFGKFNENLSYTQTYDIISQNEILFIAPFICEAHASYLSFFNQ